MRIILALTLSTLLCSCESSEERRNKWIAFCIEGEFTAKQCGVLYALKQSSDDAESAAISAQMMGAASLGASMNAGARR